MTGARQEEAVEGRESRVGAYRRTSYLSLMPDQIDTAETSTADATSAGEPRPLTPAALRALAEAAERRALALAHALPTEHGGPRGQEPTRYGDWEKKGLAIDF